MAKLVNIKTKNEIKVGDVVFIFNGEQARIDVIEQPTIGEPAGRVQVTFIEDGMARGNAARFTPGVLDAVWEGKE